MDNNKDHATLLVDGEFLKTQILASGEPYIPQNVMRFLSHAVGKIQSVYPNLNLSVFYYGYTPVQNVVHPISQRSVVEVDMKRYLFENHRLPGARFKSFWGRSAKFVDFPWVMKPESYLKDSRDLTDDDFVLNVQRKGVLTKMVDMMAEKAILKEDARLFIWGDETDLKYAISMSEGLGMPVDRLTQTDDGIIITSSSGRLESEFFDKNALDKIANSKQHMQEGTLSELLSRVRSITPENDSLLLLDGGVIRRFLREKGSLMSKQNMQGILAALQVTFAGDDPKKIFYHAHLPPKLFENPKTGKAHRRLTKEVRLESLGELDMALSIGQMYQSEEYPFILKKNKWFVPHEVREERDFEPNVHQHDVDDRIVYDMVLARFSPNIKKIYLLATDGDFVYSIEKAREAGMQVVVIQLGDEVRQMSRQLRWRANDCLAVENIEDGLLKKKVEKKAQREKHDAERRERFRSEKQAKKQHFLPRREVEDDDDFPVRHRETKEERMGQQRAKHRKSERDRVMTSRRKMKQFKRESR